MIIFNRLSYHRFLIPFCELFWRKPLSANEAFGFVFEVGQILNVCGWNIVKDPFSTEDTSEPGAQAFLKALQDGTLIFTGDSATPNDVARVFLNQFAPNYMQLVGAERYIDDLISFSHRSR